MGLEALLWGATAVRRFQKVRVVTILLVLFELAELLNMGSYCELGQVSDGQSHGSLKFKMIPSFWDQTVEFVN